MTMGRPVCEADGEQIRLALKQCQLRAKDQLVRLEAFEDGNLCPLGQSQFTLNFVGIPDALALCLEAQRKIACPLKVRGHDLVQPFGGRKRGVRGRENHGHG